MPRRAIVRVAFTGGGTGGHIYPALAIIDALKNGAGVSGGGGFDIFYIGRREGMDRALVEGAGVRFYGISAGKFRRSLSLKNFSDIFRIFRAFFEARRILKKEAPVLLFSKGGFVSAPPAAAAFSLKIPVWTHESDFSPGLATKLNSIFAARIFTTYEESARFFSAKTRKKIFCAGNPVRSVFRNASAERGRVFIAKSRGASAEDRLPEKIILVLGGSQGAKELNDLVLSNLDALRSDFFVVHQYGSLDTSNFFPRDLQNYLPLSYIKDEMPDLLACASLVVGRSGAGTVWEAASAGAPMLLVPLSGDGTRGDQVENARYFERRGAALVLIKPSTKEFLDAIQALFMDEGKLVALAAASKEVGTKDALKAITGEISRLLCGYAEKTA